MRLPRYTGKDYLVLAIILVPYTLLLNSIILGWEYFRSITVFSIASFITTFTHIIYFVLCGLIALNLKSRFAAEHQVPFRLTLMIVTFLLFSGVYLIFLFWTMDRLGLIPKNHVENAFVWAYISQAIINIFLTFEDSLGAVPFSTIVTLLLLWLCCSSPLVLIGAFIAAKKKRVKNPGKINTVPRSIPPQPWYLELKFGLIPRGL